MSWDVTPHALPAIRRWALLDVEDSTAREERHRTRQASRSGRAETVRQGAERLDTSRGDAPLNEEIQGRLDEVHGAVEQGAERLDLLKVVNRRRLVQVAHQLVKSAHDLRVRARVSLGERSRMRQREAHLVRHAGNPVLRHDAAPYSGRTADPW